MSLSIACVGSCSAAIQGPLNGETKIFFQGANGSIREWSGIGPLAFGAKYSGRVIVPPGVAKAQTPISVTTWGDTKNGNFNEIRLYFISKNNTLREMISTDFSNSWGPGVLNNEAYEVAPETSLLYAICTTGCPRVGFQLASNPNAVTEATWNNGWTTTALG